MHIVWVFSSGVWAYQAHWGGLVPGLTGIMTLSMLTFMLYKVQQWASLDTSKHNIWPLQLSKLATCSALRHVDGSAVYIAINTDVVVGLTCEVAASWVWEQAAFFVDVTLAENHPDNGRQRANGWPVICQIHAAYWAWRGNNQQWL